MGVDSGLPTFRDDRGFWRAYPPFKQLGVGFAELATPAPFVTDPTLAWGFYGHRLDLYRRAVPHAGFEVLWCWGSAVPSGMGVLTSNIDGLFQRAGFDRVAEVHGSIHHLQCVRPCSDDVWPADGLVVEVDPQSMRATGPLPCCRNCGGLARPNVLMFGDSCWVGTRSWDGLDELTAWRRGLREANLVVLELGAGSAVQTVRRHAELASTANGALIRINPQDPQIRDGRGVSLALGAAEALTGIDARLVSLR
ncbi:NAD-dependent protein deacetylase [Virgisporangium aurantiacum]|uniref:protein acetyllysine N-acetyltransferase n=2 Tax=Virgisporangium aurantiacum TaxID=175570 RepID=A0A8J3ZFG3_9ACTN|nr:NAD-dependent protein deacetylase [Virgisporangium aurantiacum]